MHTISAVFAKALIGAVGVAQIGITEAQIAFVESSAFEWSAANSSKRTQ